MGHFTSYYKSKLSYVWDADLLLFWERTSGTMSDAWKLAYNTLIVELKAAGLWEKFDVLHVYASHNEADARLNLIKDAHTATAHNSPTFTIKQGFTGNGIGTYINSHFLPANDGVKFSQSDASFGVILFSNTGNTNCLIGVYDGAVFNELFVVGGFCYCLINDADANLSFAYANTTGIHGVSRSGNTKIANINGSSYSASSSATSMPAADEFVLARNVFGASDLSTAGVSVRWSSSYLSHSEMNSLKNIIDDFKLNIAAL